MKLLLVEDDIEISQMLKSYLEAENYEVICAVDGEEACEKFEKESLMIGNFTINLMNYTVEKNGTKIDLTAKEFEILKLLVQNPQKVYTKEQMFLDFYELLKQKEFQVEVKIPEEAVFIMGNKEALPRILYNLISNVIRYGLDGRYLGLVLRSVKNDVYIDVIDKGKGIEKEFAGNVFERLFTMEDSRNRRIQGNGLGLTIAQTLAQQLGGEIVLESEPNVKTTFTVKLHKCFF